jgi:hypothetical protein
MRYFEGRGYSEEFVSNFYKIIDEFGSNPVIQVVNYPDVICGKCPYNINSMCTRNDKDSEEYVKEKDDFILKELDLNQKIAFNLVRCMVDDKLTILRRICKDCEWLEYCKD